MNRISQFVQEVSASTEEQMASTEDIVQQVEKLSKLARNVAAAEEQSSSIEETVKTAENVSRITGQTARDILILPAVAGACREDAGDSWSVQDLKEEWGRARPAARIPQ